MMHSSRTVFVSGQAQQILHGGFLSSPVADGTASAGIAQTATAWTAAASEHGGGGLPLHAVTADIY